MESYIRVKKEELNKNFLEKIKLLIEGLKKPEIIIQIRDVSEKNYFQDMDASIKQIDENKVVTFTMEELEKYLKSTN